MAKYTGSALYANFIYSGGTVALTGTQRTLSYEATIDTVDVTSGADTEKSYLTTLGDATMSMTILDNASAGSAVRRACARGNYGTLTWGPEGSAVGKPKYSCAAWVTGFSTEYPYDGEVEFEVSFQKDGNWISNYEISGSTY